MKSAESNRRMAVEDNMHESCPEVDGVTYRPGVYKIPMVRMSERGLTNLRTKGSKPSLHRNVQGRTVAVSVVE